MARQYWPGEDALGKRFTMDDPARNPWMTIVGVAGDVRQMGIDEPVKAEMYFPYQQDNDSAFYAPRDLVIRTSVDPLSLVAVREQRDSADRSESANFKHSHDG